jgi:small subunit ribosomal protein S6
MPAKGAYDLMVLIDSELPEESQTELVDGIKKQIESGGGLLKGHADWGVRKLTFEIRHRTEAHYQLFQLEADPPLLAQLDHSLKIQDAVLRHRVIRLSKGAPETTPTPGPPARQATATEQEPAEAEQQQETT